MAPTEPPAGLPEGVRARPLIAADITDAVGLAEEAGWNQIAADWRIFLDLGEPIGLTDPEGRLIATASALPYGGRFGWISMVLVTARHRRRGLARWLLRQCVERLLAQGLVPGLDATPAGRLVYLDLGFRDSWGMTRLVRRAPSAPAEAAAPAGVMLRPLVEADWPALIAYDTAVFGADRGLLLRRLAARLPAAALVAERGGRIAGFMLGRDGRIMSQLGPVVAEDDTIVRALFARGMAAVPGPVTIDLANRHQALGAWLAGQGFAAERPLTRMIYERDTAFDDAARLFAVAGPELG